MKESEANRKTEIVRFVAEAEVIQGVADLAPFISLAGTELQRVNLSGIDLSGADLSDADLSRAELKGTVLMGAARTGAA